MKYSDKLKFCKQVNNDPIFQEYSHGIRCCCFKDIHNVQHLQVMHLGCHSFLQSTKCDDWEDDYILEWIMHATHALKEKLVFITGDIPF